jgi:hypothetical protein
MRGKARQILESATACAICGGSATPDNPLVVKDLNPFSAGGFVPMEADVTPNPQAVHRLCEPRPTSRREATWTPVL